MAVICPTVTAYDLEQYRQQLGVASNISSRIHVDLMDGVFAPTKSPEIADLWLPHGARVDIHLMYQEPMAQLDALLKLKPSMIIVHAEAHVHHMHFVAELHKEGVEAGLAIMPETPVENIEQIMHSFDHVLIFSGNLGHHGGAANLELLNKVNQIKNHHPEVEIGWDGGINDQNTKQLVDSGVDILNVGGFIQASENPSGAYEKLQATL